MTINYRDTLNLPVTDFSMKAGLPRKEPEILNMWSDKNIYNKIRKKYEDKDLFLLHDGPPYANGDIHLGHSVNKILKDITIKHKTMQGYNLGKRFLIGLHQNSRFCVDTSEKEPF